MVTARVLYKRDLQDSDSRKCTSPICTFGEEPAFEIVVVFISLRFIYQVYALMILRQHWVNKRDGEGDARANKSKEIPEYIVSQQSWV